MRFALTLWMAVVLPGCGGAGGEVLPGNRGWTEARDQPAAAAECYEVVITRLRREIDTGIVVSEYTTMSARRLAERVQEILESEGLSSNPVLVLLSERLAELVETPFHRVEVLPRPEGEPPIYVTSDTRAGHGRGLSYFNVQRLEDAYPGANASVQFTPVAFDDARTRGALVVMVKTGPQDVDVRLEVLRLQQDEWVATSPLPLYSQEAN